MTNMATPMVTPRKMEALVAVFLGGKPWDRVAGPDDAPVLSRSLWSRAGGATNRMVDELKYKGPAGAHSGLLTVQSRNPMYDEPEENKLTAKGYRTIIEQAKGRFERILAPHVARLEKEFEERERFEMDRDRRFNAAKAERSRLEEEKRAQRDRETAIKARNIMAEHLQDAHAMSDEQVLDFVDRIASL